MPSVQIKDVPEETHRVLRMRAAHAHQSLQEYLLSRLVEEASQPTMEEALARAAEGATADVGFQIIVDLIRADRDSH